MDVSGETADLVVREAVQVSEEVIKFLGAGAKNLTAFLAAMYSQNNKVVGKTTARRLARDPAPAEIIQLKKADIPRFQKLAKQYGVLYFFVHKDDPRQSMTNVVSNSNYAPQLNAIMEELGYPIPQKARRILPQKKPSPALDPNDPRKSERMARKRGRGLRCLKSLPSGDGWPHYRRHPRVWNMPDFPPGKKYDKEGFPRQI